MKFLILAGLVCSTFVNAELVQISGNWYDKQVVVNSDGSTKTIFNPVDYKGEQAASTQKTPKFASFTSSKSSVSDFNSQAPSKKSSSSSSSTQSDYSKFSNNSKKNTSSTQ